MILVSKSNGGYVQKEVDDLDSIVLSHVDVLVTGAHQDDEAFAYPFVERMYPKNDAKVGVVIATTGVGSNTEGISNIVEVRNRESINAGIDFGLEFLLLLGHSSESVKSTPEFREEVTNVLRQTNPKLIFTHSPYDQHRTHFKVAEAVAEASRDLIYLNVFGYPVWGSLIEWSVGFSNRMEFNFYREELQKWARFIKKHFMSQVSANPYDEAMLARARFQSVMKNAHQASVWHYTEFLIDYSPFTKRDFNGSFEDYVRVLKVMKAYEDEISQMSYSERLRFAHQVLLPQIAKAKKCINSSDSPL